MNKYRVEPETVVIISLVGWAIIWIGGAILLS